jgi:hypothetical protein
VRLRECFIRREIIIPQKGLGSGSDELPTTKNREVDLTNNLENTVYSETKKKPIDVEKRKKIGCGPAKITRPKSCLVKLTKPKIAA